MGQVLAPVQRAPQEVNAGVGGQVQPPVQAAPQVQPPPQGVNRGVGGIPLLDDSAAWISFEIQNVPKVVTLTHKQVANLLGFRGTQEEMVIPRGDYFFYKSEEVPEPRIILAVPNAIYLKYGNLVYIRPRKLQRADHIPPDVIQSFSDHGSSPLELLEMAYDDIKAEVYFPTDRLTDSWRRDNCCRMLFGGGALRRNSLNKEREKLENNSFSTSSLLGIVEECGELALRAKVRHLKRYLEGNLHQVQRELKKLDELIARNNKILVLIGFISTILAWGLAAVLVHAAVKKKRYTFALTVTLTSAVGTTMLLMIWLAVYALMH